MNTAGDQKPGGYAGRILRLDLTRKTVVEEHPSPAMLRHYVGGTGLGARYLYAEVPAGVEWSHPDNRLILATGPLAGTRAAGSGTYSAVTKGPMTNLAGATQANGFFGAFLKLSGVDGLILQGAADRWVYVYVHDGTAEIRDASFLLGKDTLDTDLALHEALGLAERELSVAAIGQAGENLVRFAAMVGDRGHVAAHNGVGAVMGSKRVKAIAVARGRARVSVADPVRFAESARLLFERSYDARDRCIARWGTAGVVRDAALAGWLPVKNYTTNVFPSHEQLDGRYLRSHFELKSTPCWACRMNHCHRIKVTEGPFSGYQGDEPEYESVAAFGSVIGNPDPGGAVMLADLTDRLGMDTNETGWVVGWVMECFERGIFTPSQLNGLEMKWGNVEATSRLVNQIARREGVGKLLAEGVKRAAEVVGGEAPNLALYSMKGATPRGHDHRGRWTEMLDTCVSGTSTIEATAGSDPTEPFGLPPITDRFDWLQVSTANARLNGRRQFEDCLGLCRFCTSDYGLTLDVFNAVTGLNLGVWDGMEVGRRIVNLLRLFNIRHGLDPTLERPSRRYGSAPVDGPAQGTNIMVHWDDMLRNYRRLMGWDEETGQPLPDTLRALGIEGLGGGI